MKRRYKILSGIVITLAIAVSALAIVLSYDAACAPAPPASSAAEQMQAIVYRCYGSPEVLKLESVEMPSPADDEVLIKINAASVNPLDWHYMRGSPYFMRLESGLGAPTDTQMGVDFSGTVVTVGASVTKYKTGDEVFGGRSGAFAEYIVVRESRALTSKPADISFAQAASVPIAGVTALQALRDNGKLQPGQSVLINGASGGVGTFAVQIAKSIGAEVTGVSSTRNLDLVRSIGADHVIDYTTTDYTEGERRYDLIVDMVGNHSVLANRRALTQNGTYVIVGAQKGNWIGPMTGLVEALVLSPFIEQNASFIMAQLRPDDLAVLAELMRDGKVTPVIDRVYKLDEVAAAIEYSELGRARGKIIISMD